MQSGFDARSSQRGSYFDYLVDTDTNVFTPDTSVTAVVDVCGEKLTLGNQVKLYTSLW